MRVTSVRLGAFAALVVLLGTASAGIAAPKEAKRAPSYLGVDACASCHKSKATGNQIAAWEKDPHSKAFATLVSEAGLAIAKKKGIADPQQAAECLRCHTTGADVSKAYRAEGFDMTRGVQCEACHGAGEHYAKIQHMISRASAVEAGLVAPTAVVCKRCHNADSPTFKGFDFATAVKRIAHPLAPK